MEAVRDFCAYLLAMVFCLMAIVLCGLAWIGLENAFGLEWAMGIVAVSLTARINLAVVIGLYFYATNILAWPMAESIAFSLPGTLILLPSIAIGVLGLITAPAARR